MRRIIFATALASMFAFTAACGDDGGDDDDDDDDDVVDVDAGEDVDGGAAGFETLITRTWTINPGETYRCAALTVEEDMVISVIRPLGPVGTHHTVLSITDAPTEDDGNDDDCGAGQLAPQMLFASGVGTDDLEFPEGVGLRIAAGQQLHLNLHLYNTTDSPISGESGTLVKLVDDVEQEAEALFSGTALFSLQANPNIDQTASGGCTFDQDATLVAVWPHQHQLGTHHKFEIHRAGGDTDVILDDDYSFSEQKNYPLDPLVQVNAGDEVETTCTWVNDSGGSVTFGDSSDKEMCFTGIYRYPATGDDLFSCTDIPF